MYRLQKSVLNVSNYKLLVINKSVSRSVLAFHFILRFMITSCLRGFMVKRSCVTQLVEVFDLIGFQLGSGGQVDIVYLAATY